MKNLGFAKNYKEARKLGIKFYWSGRKCPNGVTTFRRATTQRCMCIECIKHLHKAKKAYYEKIKNTEHYQRKVKDQQERTREWKREYDKQYRARTSEKQKAWSDAWAAANPEKVKAIKQNYKARRNKWESSGQSSKEIGEWAKQQKKVCYWCNIKCDKDYHIDHYKPLARGGKHCTSNMVISCPQCNMKKKAKDPYEWAQEVGRLF